MKMKQEKGLLDIRGIRTTEDLERVNLLDYVDPHNRNWLRFIEPATPEEIYRIHLLSIKSTKYFVIPNANYLCAFLFFKH